METILFPNSAAKIIEESLSNNLSIQFGSYLYKNGKIKNFYYNELNYFKLILGLFPPHHGLILLSKDFQILGKYNENFKICSDFDYYIRAFKIQNYY